MRPFAPNRSTVNRGSQTPGGAGRGGTGTVQGSQSESAVRPPVQEQQEPDSSGSATDRGEQVPGGVGSGVL